MCTIIYAHAQSRTYRSPAMSLQATLPRLPMPGFGMATLFLLSSAVLNYLQKTLFKKNMRIRRPTKAGNDASCNATE